MISKNQLVKKKKKKNENSPPNTTIEKSWWLLCTKSRFTYNKANQLSKILFYQDISIFAKCYLPKSASNQIYFSLTFGIYTSSSSSRLSIAQTCVLKYHPKHADSTKKLSSYSVLVLSYSWHCQICCHVWINIQNGYN